VIVGVNKFTEGSEKPPEIQRIDPKLEQAQIDRLRRFREGRDNMKVRSMLSQLEKSAKSEKKNLVPDILSAVRGDCTLGEISDVLRNIYGEYRVRIAM